MNPHKTTITLQSPSESFQNKIKFLVIAALTIIPLVFVPLGGDADHYYFPKLIAMFFFTLLYLITYILHFRKVQTVIDRDSINLALFFYFIFLLISVYFAGNRNLALFGLYYRYEGFFTLILYICLFLMARSFPKIKDNYFKYILISAIIVAVYGILQYHGIDPFPRDEAHLGWNNVPLSTMGNPNFLGLYLVLILPISIYFYVINKSKIYLISYTILLYCLLATNTRGAWLGAIAGIISFVILHYIYHGINKKEFSRYITIFIISVLILVFFNFQSGGNFADRVATISDNAKDFVTQSENVGNTGSNRGFIWIKTIELIKQRPLTGYGIEGLGEAFEKHYDDEVTEHWGEPTYVDKAHNIYLHIAATTGIPSLIAFLIFIFLILKKGIIKFQNQKNILLLLSGVAGYLVTGFFSISIVSVAYIFWIYLGLTSSNDLKA